MTFTGLTIKMTTPPITPPMYGPKYGIILVMPTITLSSTAYGKRKIVVHTKQIIPIIRESIALPIIKLEKYYRFHVEYCVSYQPSALA